MARPPTAQFTASNTRAAYQLRYHFGWYSHGRQDTFSDPPVRAVLQQAFKRVAEHHGYHVLELEFEPAVVRALLSLTPPHAPAEASRIVKGNLAAEARRRLDLGQLWSRGWFVRGVGAVTGDVVRKYVENQFDHHRAAPLETPGTTSLATFHGAGDPAKLRTASHAAFQYNVHLVFATRRRSNFFDMHVAGELIDYWQRVCDKHRWRPWDIEVVWNHAHLLLGLPPTDSPQHVALSLMNNSAHFLERRYGGPLRDAELSGVWQPGFYAGTVGSATTAQVKAFLRARAEGDAPPG